MLVEEKLSALGLSDIKIKETVRNPSLSSMLAEIYDMASKHGSISKATGNLLYNLGTKLPKQFYGHLPFLVSYVASGKLNQEAKLSAAIKFVQDHSADTVDCKEFEKTCGVGIEVSQDEIEATVKHIIDKHKEPLIQQRYHFNIGILMGEARNAIKWADSKSVKEEIELQILMLLGPKSEDDLLKPVKEKSKNNIKKTNQSEEDSKSSLIIDKGPTTMKEFLKTVNFHDPGENHKTDGYVICENTHKLLEEHLKLTGRKVQTRFPPEPNGILHIGHAKAININFGYAAAHDGICILRYDDTNPEKEEEIFFKGIKEMVEWLGYKPFKITHSSDYFDQLYEWAKILIKKGLAYVCHQKPEDIKGYSPPPSPWRNRPVLVSLTLFEDMRKGKFDEGEATLRLKLTLEEGKVDPVAYRIKFVPHHRTGDSWCIYPTYDYTHCLCDSIEHITHSLCTKEFQNRRSSYYWLCNSLDIYCPVQWEYGRLNMQYAVVSKRKIAKLIETGHVRNWDDPRLFTLTALRRRGFPPEAVNNFVATLGLTGAQVTIHPDALNAAVRDSLNTTATRVMCVLDPLHIVLENYSFDGPQELEVPNIPGDESKGYHKVFFDKEIWISTADFRETEEKGYRRLTLNQSVGLKHCGYVLHVKEVVKSDTGDIKQLRVNCSVVSEFNKPKAFVHWVACPLQCEVRLYEKLFLHECPEDQNVVPGGFLEDINANSLLVLDNALIDISVKNSKVFDKFQFERVGFFSVDPDSSREKLVFNRTISLQRKPFFRMAETNVEGIMINDELTKKLSH